jgi:2-polyprenyl-3-methyl-5-hydroxy-6-metoxy-1,4-benzoquinol methylase
MKRDSNCPCPVCGSEKTGLAYEAMATRVDEQKKWSIFSCDSCSHGFLYPQPTLKQLAHYYSASYDPYEVDHGIDSIEKEVAIAKENNMFRHVRIVPGMNVLDVGCGGGAFLSVCKALGADVFGVEPSEYGVAATKKVGLNVFHGTLDKYISVFGAEHKFDLITANHVVEHHENPVALLSQMSQLLKPNGLIWISVPNISSRTAKILQGKWHSIDVPFHLMHFTPESAKLTVKNAGLRVTKQYTYSLPQAVRISLITIWRFRYFLPRRISLKLSILNAISGVFARRMDRQGRGEAIIIEAMQSKNDG